MTEQNDAFRAQLEELKSEFLNVVSHELRTPVTIARWSTEVVLDGYYGAVENKKVKEALEKSYEAMGRLNESLNGIITALLAAENKITLAQGPVRLREFLDDTILHHHPRIAQKSITLHIAHEGAPKEVHADKSALRHIVHTLLENAVDYTPEGGAITLTATSGDCGCAHLSIADSGVGVPPECRTAIFEKFYRGKWAVAMKPDGLGLNLFIARKFAEAHGGTLVIEETTQAKGAQFTCIIPTEGAPVH